MTTVVYRHDPPGIVARGHADYSDKGRDIVCAAVSVLFMTLPEALSDCGISAKIRTGDGYFRAEAVTEPDNREKAETVFRTVLSGVRLLAENYPNHISLRDAEETQSGDMDEIMRIYMQGRSRN